MQGAPLLAFCARSGSLSCQEFAGGHGVSFRVAFATSQQAARLAIVARTPKPVKVKTPAFDPTGRDEHYRPLL